MTPRTILIAEDNPELLEVLALQFDWRGYRVLRARDGVEALELLEHKPDLVLLDVVMPRKNGYEVCRSLKNDPRRRDMPVILLSGRKAEIEREWGMECGADAYVTKPFGIAELEARIGELLSRQESAPAPGPQAASAAPDEKTLVRWVLDPRGVRPFRQKYGELAYQRVLRDLPQHLLHKLTAWGVEGCVARSDYDAVSLVIPGPRRRIEACLERLTALGNDFVASYYDSADLQRGAIQVGEGPEEEELPLLRLLPRSARAPRGGR